MPLPFSPPYRPILPIRDVRQGARELFIEMVTRLGRAREAKETSAVLMALNLLLPFGLHAMVDVDGGSLSQLASSTARGDAMGMISSLDITSGNRLLIEYIDANAMMLLDHLRRQLSSRLATSEEKGVALHALHQLLKILQALSLIHI